MENKSFKKSFLKITTVSFLCLGIFLFVRKSLDSKRSFIVEVSPGEKSIKNQSVSIQKVDEPQKTKDVLTENYNDTKQKNADLTIPQKATSIEDEKKVDTKENKDAYSVKRALVSWGFEVPTEKRVIDTIIIHSSYDALGDDPYDVDGLIAEYKIYGVTAHYLIDRKGTIYQLVVDKNIAYHAGESKTPDGRTNVNYFSIGIELMNTEKDKNTKEQYSSLKNILSELKKTYSIKYVLGHDDISPKRKSDPWNFDWDKVENK